MMNRRRTRFWSRLLFAGLCAAGVLRGVALAQPADDPVRRPRMDVTAPAAPAPRRSAA